MPTLQAGEFRLAKITFTDGSASKIRPVLVLWLDERDAVVAAVTSALPRTPTDVALQRWQDGGLRVASTVRLSRLDCFAHAMLGIRLGRIHPDDAQTIKNVWSMHVRLDF